jgi:hypothetical protein
MSRFSAFQTWLHETANAKTIKEVAHALLDLEDGVRILNDRRTQFPKDYAAWRKTVSTIHTYDLVRTRKLLPLFSWRLIEYNAPAAVEVSEGKSISQSFFRE